MPRQGIVLLELALWRSAINFPEFKQEPIIPLDAKKKFLHMTTRELPHRVGQKFSDVIAVCLDFREISEGTNDFECHKLFVDRVTNSLGQLVGHV